MTSHADNGNIEVGTTWDNDDDDSMIPPSPCAARVNDRCHCGGGGMITRVASRRVSTNTTLRTEGGIIRTSRWTSMSFLPMRYCPVYAPVPLRRIRGFALLMGTS